MPREKVTIEERVTAAKDCVEGRLSQSEAARRLGVDESAVRGWVKRYKANGERAFQKQEHNAVYSIELKLEAVKKYLSGSNSLEEIAARYGLRSKSQLRCWIKQYNSGKEFGRKISGGSHMKQGRETSQKERIIIAKDCLEHGCNYGEIAIKHNVSYQQVYTWVKKFKELGEAGLEDRRGKRTADQTARTPEEELRIRIAQLEHELYMTRMERDLLKKVDALERGDTAYRK